MIIYIIAKVINIRLPASVGERFLCDKGISHLTGIVTLNMEVTWNLIKYITQTA